MGEDGVKLGNEEKRNRCDGNKERRLQRMHRCRRFLNRGPADAAGTKGALCILRNRDVMAIARIGVIGDCGMAAPDDRFIVMMNRVQHCRCAQMGAGNEKGQNEAQSVHRIRVRWHRYNMQEFQRVPRLP